MSALLECLEDRRLLSGASPVAVNDSYTTPEDTALVVAAAGVLTNDTDAESDALSAAVVAAPAHGTLTLNANGSFTYTPAANFNGADSFTYKANDGTSDSNAAATVNISVTAVNDPPVAVADSYTTNEDSPLVVASPGLLTNDTDVEASALTAVLVAGPTHGSLTLNADGSFSYTPATNFNGTDSFTYKANDGTTDGNVVAVNITVNAVNDLPVAANDTYRTPVNTPLVVASSVGVLANDTDVDGNPLTAVLVTNGTHGTVALAADGSFTYTPTAAFHGVDTFTYKANDATGDSNVVTVTIKVNTAPVAVADSYAIDEDTQLTIAAPGVLVNDTDADADPRTAVLATGPTHGNLTFNPDGSFTYVPVANYHGPDSFTYKANDGIDDSSATTVNITVNSVNDLPVANNNTYATNEDTPLVITAALGVLANDTDADSNPLSAILVDAPAHGTLTLNPDGSFTYTPAANFNGPDSFTYKANDGTGDSNVATVNITVNAVNDLPVAGADTYTIAEDGVLTVAVPGVLVNDTDVESTTLTAVLDVGPTHGTLTLNADGSFVYTPTANFRGTDSFTYRASDGLGTGAVATVSITVTPVNDVPIAGDDNYTTATNTTLTVPMSGVLVNDSDVDGDVLSAVLVTGPLNGTLTLNPNGSFTYTPNAGFNGVDVFTYRVSDSIVNSVNPATVKITVSSPANNAPTATGFTVLRNPGSAAQIDVLAHATDPDSDPLGISISVTPSHGRAFVDNNGTPSDFSDDQVEYLPNTDYFGSDTLTYKVSDGRGGTSTAVVSIQARQFGLSASPIDPTKTDLVVLGTTGNDTISLIQSGTKGVKVVINGVNKGVFAPTGRVIADGLAGNDIITAAGLKRSVILYGNAGNDTLTGGALPSMLYGGAGNDTLHGGSAHRDLLDGGAGKNVLA